MAAPLFEPPSQKILKNGDIKPRYVCTSDSLIHVNIVVVSTVLALDAILIDTKKEGVVFWTCSQMQTEGVVFQTRSQI